MKVVLRFIEIKTIILNSKNNDKNIPDKIINFINKTTDLDQIRKIKSNAQEKSNLDLVKICNLQYL